MNNPFDTILSKANASGLDPLTLLDHSDSVIAILRWGLRNAATPEHAIVKRESIRFVALLRQLREAIEDMLAQLPEDCDEAESKCRDWALLANLKSLASLDTYLEFHLDGFECDMVPTDNVSNDELLELVEEFDCEPDAIVN